MEPKREEFAFVLDFLPYGKSSEATKEPVAQLVGETGFTLLEVTVKPGAKLAAEQRVYIGKGDRVEIDHIKRRINYPELTSSAQKELKPVVEKIVSTREAEFIAFINRAGPINIRSHVLELLPSIGKKHLTAILAEREKKPFTNFADFHSRVSHVTSLQEIICMRILEEITAQSKYYLFVKQPRREE